MTKFKPPFAIVFGCTAMTDNTGEMTVQFGSGDLVTWITDNTGTRVAYIEVYDAPDTPVTVRRLASVTLEELLELVPAEFKRDQTNVGWAVRNCDTLFEVTENEEDLMYTEVMRLVEHTLTKEQQKVKETGW